MKRTIICVLTVFTLLMCLQTFAQQQSGHIVGIITDGMNNMPNARVKLPASTVSTTANDIGEFTLSGIDSPDSLNIFAWSEGFYNGHTSAAAGDSGVVITLRLLPTVDNPGYEWCSHVANMFSDMECGNCHNKGIVAQWESNAHSSAATNPNFLAFYNGTTADGSTDAGYGYRTDNPDSYGNCGNCHIPGAAVDEPDGVDPNTVNDLDIHGIFCDFCHKVGDVKPSTNEDDSGVQSMSVLRPPPGKEVFFGPYVDVTYPDSYLPLMSKSEFCAACHTGVFNDLLIFPTYHEWRESKYAEDEIHCQACHMAPDGIMTNFAPGFGGLERDPQTLASHKQQGSRDPEILANSVTMHLQTTQLSDTLLVTVTIINDKTGHHVPSGNPERNMILLVSASDKDDNPLLFDSGGIVPFWGGIGSADDGCYAGLPGKGFAKLLSDDNGNSPSAFWSSSEISSDTRLAAFEEDITEYRFILPDDTKLITANAELLFRRFYKQTMTDKNIEIDDIIMEQESLTTRIASSVNVDSSIPEGFRLDANFPNPFNPSTTIEFSLPEAGLVDLVIFNIMGQKVRELASERMTPGMHSTVWDGRNDSGMAVSSGIYIMRLKAGEMVETKRMLLMK